MPGARRVARRGYPLQAPTDPDVPVSGIRLLGNSGSLRGQRAVHNLDLGQRIPLEKTSKTSPAELAPLGAPPEPCSPYPDNPAAELLQTSAVARLSVISIMPVEFLDQVLVLPPELGMPMLPAPGIDPLQGTAQPSRVRLPLHHPRPPLRLPPIQGKPQQVDRPRPRRDMPSPTWRVPIRRTGQSNHPGLVRMKRQAVLCASCR